MPNPRDLLPNTWGSWPIYVRREDTGLVIGSRDQTAVEPLTIGEPGIIAVRKTGTLPDPTTGYWKLAPDGLGNFLIQDGGTPATTYGLAGSEQAVYAGISVEQNATPTVIAAAGVPVQLNIFTTNDPFNVAAPSFSAGSISIPQDGDYFIIATAIIESEAGPGSTFEITVQKNGTSVISPFRVSRDLAAGLSSSESVIMSGIAALNKDDDLQLYIANLTGTENYIIVNSALSLRLWSARIP